MSGRNGWPRRGGLRAALAGLPLLALLLPLAAATQEPPARPESGVFADTVDVAVVNVDVVVTDASGARVTGLGCEEFELFEDGRPVEIAYFQAFEPGRRERSPAAPPVTAGEAPVPPAGPPAPPEDQRLRLVVYVDNFNLRPAHRARVLRQVREFLHHRIAPGDEVMLVTYDRSLRVQVPFTGDPAPVNQALLEVEATGTSGLQADSERDRMVRAIEEAESPGEVARRVRQYAQSLHNDLRFTLGAMKRFVEALAGLPGRKAILHVSDGLPLTPAEDLFYGLQEKFPSDSLLHEARAFDAARSFQELAASANSNRVTFYTIDAAGLRLHSAADAGRRGSGFNRLSASIDAIRVSNLQGPLRLLADATGGLAIVNTNDFGPGLERVAEDLESFYSLGFTPAHRGDGRYHALEVRVRRKGLRVRHREGYRDRDVESRMIDATTATLLFDVERNDLGIEVEAGAQSRHDDGQVAVSFQVRLPFARLVLLEGESLHRADVRLYVAAMDEAGGLSPVQTMALPIRLPADLIETALRESFVYEFQLLLRPGRHKVAVGARDQVGATVSFLGRYVDARGDSAG